MKNITITLTNSKARKQATLKGTTTNRATTSQPSANHQPTSKEECIKNLKSVKEVEEGLPPQLFDPVLKSLSKHYTENGFGPIFPKTADTLLYLAEAYTEGWVIMAIEKAGKLGKRNLGYTEGILKGWVSDGGPDKGNPTNGKSSNNNGQPQEDYSDIGLSF